MLNGMRSSFTYRIQLSNGSFSKTWDQVLAEGRVMRWLRTGHGYLCLEENHQSTHSRMNLHLFTFWTQVRTSCHFIWIASKFGTAEHIKYLKADSPQDMRTPRPSSIGLPFHPENLNGKTSRVIGGDFDVENSSESVICEHALSPDQVRALSPSARGGTPTGPSRVLGQPIEQMRSPNNMEERIETWKKTGITDHRIEQAYAPSTYSFSILVSEARPELESDVWTIEVPGDCVITPMEVQSGVQSRTNSLSGHVPPDLSDLYNGAGSRSGRKRNEKSLKKEASDKRNENYLEDTRSYS